MRFVVIELQLDSENEECHDTIIEAAREAAQLLRAQTAMLSGANPGIKLKTWKMYEEENIIPIDPVDYHAAE